MASIREAVQQTLTEAKGELPKKLGFAWALGFGTLYKFMSFAAGELRDRVVDVIKNSRFFCPTPDLFNDPYEVCPVIRHGGDPANPAYIAELEYYERLAMKRRGMSDEQIEKFRALHGVDVHRLADEARDDLRLKIRADARSMPDQDRSDLLSVLDQHRPDLPVWRAGEDYDRFWMRIERVR